MSDYHGGVQLYVGESVVPPFADVG